LSWLTLSVILTHAVLATATALHALMFKRDPRAAFGWIGVCVLLPIGGPVLYGLFGLNRARGRARQLHLRRRSPSTERRAHLEPVPPLPAGIRQPYRNLARIGQALSRHSLLEGNTVKPLLNGESAFPAMLEAIQAATSHVLLTTYILDSDASGEQFRRALTAAADRGVNVQVLLDGFGDWYSRPRASRVLHQAGVRVARFLPPQLLPPSLSINMRNHHKILVVDDRLGFTGGMNIGDRHRIELADNPRPTADMHFQLEGPIVGQLREEFLRLWQFATGDHDEPPMVRPRPSGDLLCRTITDGPDEDIDRLTMLLGAAMAEARESVRIMTPYFLPPRELIGAIQAAAVRGVAVTVILPEVNNLPYLHWATRNMLWEILMRGVRVVYQPPPFNHAKLFVVDGYYSLIGSANWAVIPEFAQQPICHPGPRSGSGISGLQFAPRPGRRLLA
jgi:cardiolipin synthase A/B